MNIKHVRRSVFCSFLFSLLAFAPHTRAAQISSLPAKDRMVVVISLDGFPAYYLADPKLPAPTLRRLIQDGSWAREMQPINPTWTWPNHTTFVTGLKPPDHGLLYNGTLVREDNPLSVKIDWSIPKVQMVHCPTLYDIAQRSGLTTAQVDWVAVNDAATITWAFPERASTSDPLVKEMIANHALSASDLEGKPTITWRDQIWTKAGAYLIRQHKPNLLLFHLLTLDSTHHNYGPKTLASYDAVAFLDGCVKQLVDAAKEAGMLDRTTFIIVSDHGFRTVYKQILLKNLLAQAKLGADVQAIPEGGSAMIYVSHTRRRELLDPLRGILSKTEGVQRVVDESDYPSLGFPLPSKDSQMPDLVAFAQAGYAFSGGTGEGGPVISKLDHAVGAHGYPNTDPDMQAIFIASGYGIRSGVTLENIQNTSVAPTLAQLLGVSLPKLESPVLNQILQ
jgi:predicted AlkP superfamily pyrophosphatase or phosphodiesterase